MQNKINLLIQMKKNNQIPYEDCALYDDYILVCNELDKPVKQKMDEIQRDMNNINSNM